MLILDAILKFMQPKCINGRKPLKSKSVTCFKRRDEMQTELHTCSR